ncbi:hypothetical protein ZHAS_00010590 [Anopheles sinensis]|uniref:Uncharacterized protein n=1 Tax=Anopheles sinensis TaxID=74873 RepID=A0A084VXZ6_ANOSI|nr:hypothetical protein ZHAS_00010590 [Anopheles sinensis]
MKTANVVLVCKRAESFTYTQLHTGSTNRTRGAGNSWSADAIVGNLEIFHQMVRPVLIAFTFLCLVKTQCSSNYLSAL